VLDSVPEKEKEMPLLEIVQTRHISASIRLTDTTAALVDQYAAFISASADEVVEQALAYVFSKDRDFQEFLKTPQAQRTLPTLRVRKASGPDAIEQSKKKPAAGMEPGDSVRVSKA
jgi:hypothetical protein